MSEVETIDITTLDGELVPFTTIDEEWHVYELEDNTIIKTKFVLMNIIAYGEPDDQGLRPSSFGTHSLTMIYSPIEIRGEPDQAWGVKDLEPFVTQKNLKFRQIQDGGFFKYETEKMLLEIDYRVTQIDKTSKFGHDGMPAYILRQKISINGSEKVDE